MSSAELIPEVMSVVANNNRKRGDEMEPINPKIRFIFNKDEENLITSVINKFMDVVTDIDITYAQAVEALERSKIELQKLFLLKK